jgi:hypothetical protein
MTDSNKRTPVPNLISDGRKLKTARAESDEEFLARKKLLEATAPDGSIPAPDIALGRGFADDRTPKNAGFDQKIYLFPEEFHALRRELEENWRDFFHTVNPLSGTSPAYCMVYDAPQFIGYCNGMTGLTVQLDTGDVAGTCKKFLNAFRKLRGVGEIG